MKRIKVNLNLDQEPVIQLKKLLLDKGISFSAWVREQIDKALEEQK